MSRTTEVFDAIDGAGVEQACGGALSKPKDTPECAAVQQKQRDQ